MAAGETKHDRFIRVAESRTNKIIDMLRVLGNCSSTNNYEYETQEVKAIFDAIQLEVDASKAKFEKASRQTNRFSLK